MGSVANTYISQINKLKSSETLIFPDSKVSPLPYDGSKLMKVNFGDWKTEDNYKGIQEISIDDLITTQPDVQANKLIRFGGAIDTSDVPVLKIGNKYYVADGNHRIVSNILSGKKKVKVKVYEEK